MFQSFKKPSTSKYGNSDFWASQFEWDDKIFGSATTEQQQNRNLYKLAGHQKAISNFVSIVTGKQIPVRFKKKGDQSYTDGKTVTISADVSDPKNFDFAVGLALHEGSHILLSDFELLRDLLNRASKKAGDKRWKAMLKLAETNKVDVSTTLREILNWIEDRRVDNHIYTNAPGYRGYYKALMDKYFNSPLIDEAIKSGNLAYEELESYMFRLINLHSKFTVVKALKSLPKIYELVDLPNISRLKTTDDALGVAVDIFEIILKSISTVSANVEFVADEFEAVAITVNLDNPIVLPSTPYIAHYDSLAKLVVHSSDLSKYKIVSVQLLLGSVVLKEYEAEENKSLNVKLPIHETGDYMVNITTVPVTPGEEPEENEDDDCDFEPGDGSGTGSSKKLTPEQLKKLRELIEKQKQFLQGNIDKDGLSDSEAANVDLIDKSSADIKKVGGEYNPGSGSGIKSVDCIVVNKMTESLMRSSSFPLAETYGGGELKNQYSQAVIDGISLGMVLGRKLQVRSEARETIYNRQTVGKLDKRMISSLGYGNEQAFFTREVDQFKKANLHISVDASGSMEGDKFRKTMVTVVAMAKAVDMISNLEIQISFRSTLGSVPYIVVAYDSRVDKFTKVKQLFQYLTPDNTTPEGLCFEAILNQLLPNNSNMDSYFVNISDGQPYFQGSGMNYCGDEAALHTKKMVDKITGMGINILSYFVSDNDRGESSNDGRTFRVSYGKTASYINVSNVVEIARTMNRLFLAK